MSTLTRRPPLPTACLDLLDRAHTGLHTACRTTSSTDRYVTAHLAALRAGAALLAARTTPFRRAHPRSVWETLPHAAPHLTDWAAFYADSAHRRAAAERGAPVTTREADDLVHHTETFLTLVETDLGLPPHTPLPEHTTPRH